MGKNWHKEMTVYQIWTRSFYDGNGDGIGDLYGVLQKLDYIQSLHADAIWFNPIYPSPNADYGYDVSNYMDIHPDFGTLEVFQQVLDEAHKRGMRVFMDLVVNHTSDEHPWFKESRKSKDNPYHDYYIWRDGKNVRGTKRPPNNWTSLFEGGAWEYDPGIDQYYLHLFAKKQPDLNMENPAVRTEVKKIMRFWLEMGVDGFREDVINYIAKTPGLPDSYPVLPMANGLKHFSNLPRVHDYLEEFKRDVLNGYDCYTVGECAMMTPTVAKGYIEEGPNQVLDEIITFDHMNADCFMTDAVHLPFSLPRLKRALTKWQTALGDKAWNALYLENHDHPRVISRYGSEQYRVESGKMLAAMYLLLKGTPFLYQGQEIGMLNLSLPDIAMYQDISSKNAAVIASKILPRKWVEALVRASTRDSARSPMQWTAGKNAGFSEADPWFFVNDNYQEINVEREEQDPDSILNFYRRLLKFRKESELILYGSYKELLPRSKELYVYERCLKEKRLLVVCSFTKKQVRFDAPESYELERGRLLFSNYDFCPSITNGYTTRPYEMRVYSFE